MKLMAENQFTPADNNEEKSLDSQSAQTPDTLKDGLFSKEKTPLDKSDKPSYSKLDFSDFTCDIPIGVYTPKLGVQDGLFNNLDPTKILDPSKIKLDSERLQVENHEELVDGTTIARAADGRILVVNPDGSKIEFDREHRISKVQLAPKDKNDQPKIREFSYNGNTLSEVKESNGTNLKLKGSEWTILDKDKQQSKLGLSVKLSDNGELSFHKGAELVSKLRLDGSVLSYDRGNVVSVVYPDNRLRTFKYDDNNNVISVNSKTSESFERVPQTSKFQIKPAENQTRQVKDPRTGQIIEQPIPPWFANIWDIRVDKETGEFRWTFTNGTEKHIYSDGTFSEVKLDLPTTIKKSQQNFGPVERDASHRICQITGIVPTSDRKRLITTIQYASEKMYCITLPDAHSDNTTKITTADGGKNCTVQKIGPFKQVLSKEVHKNANIEIKDNGCIELSVQNGKTRFSYCPDGRVLIMPENDEHKVLVSPDGKLTYVGTKDNKVVSYARVNTSSNYVQSDKTGRYEISRQKLAPLAEATVRGMIGNEGTNDKKKFKDPKQAIHLDKGNSSANLGMMSWNLRSYGANELIHAMHKKAISMQAAAGIDQKEPNEFEKRFLGWANRDIKAKMKPILEAQNYRGTILDPQYQKKLSNVLTEHERFPKRKNASDEKSAIRKNLEWALKTFDVQEELAQAKSYQTMLTLFKQGIDCNGPYEVCSLVSNFTDVYNQAGPRGLDKAIQYYKNHPKLDEEKRIEQSVIAGVSRANGRDRYNTIIEVLQNSGVIQKIKKSCGENVSFRALVSHLPRRSEKRRIANNR